MIWSAVCLRCEPCLSSTNMKPVLSALPPPMNEIMWDTAGWACTTRLRLSCRSFMAANETSCGPSVVPESWPVSCCGNSPFGTTTYK